MAIVPPSTLVSDLSNKLQTLQNTVSKLALVLEQIGALINDKSSRITEINSRHYKMWLADLQNIAQDVEHNLLHQFDVRKICERFEKLLTHAYHLGLFTSKEASSMVTEILPTASLANYDQSQGCGRDDQSDPDAIMDSLLGKWELITLHGKEASGFSCRSISSDDMHEIQADMDDNDAMEFEQDVDKQHEGSFASRNDYPSDMDDKDDAWDGATAFTVSRLSQLEKLPERRLRTLSFGKCKTLEIIPSEIIDSLTSMQSLTVYDCPRLKYLPQGHTRTTSLQYLNISKCKNLQLPPPGVLMNQYAVLETLYLHSCASIESFPINAFPRLELLSIAGCGRLKSLSGEKGLPASIEVLAITDCNNLEAACDVDDGFSAPNLCSIEMERCAKIRSLPTWIQSATSLETLRIHYCPELISLSKKGLAASLKHLNLSSCDKLTPETLKLEKLDSLKSLRIQNMWQLFPESGFPAHKSFSYLLEVDPELF